MAIDSDRGRSAFVTPTSSGPAVTTLALVGPEGLNLPHEEDLDAVRATAARAAELGVQTELLRVTTRHPATALLEIVRERNAGLLVFGPHLKLTSKLRFRRVARRRAARPAGPPGRARRVARFRPAGSRATRAVGTPASAAAGRRCGRRRRRARASARGRRTSSTVKSRLSVRPPGRAAARPVTRPCLYVSFVADV
jgi:nucleotide-binding universal stress UspA family protein